MLTLILVALLIVCICAGIVVTLGTILVFRIIFDEYRRSCLVDKHKYDISNLRNKTNRFRWF